MTFKLKNQKNQILKNLADLFDEYFPNYEIFYNNFIYELKGYDNHWRNDTFDYFEELGISDYGILKSLNYIHLVQNKIGVNDPEQKFKNAYFHFGLTFDTIENILKCIIYIKNKLNNDDQSIKIKSKNELIDKFKKWIDKRYIKEFNKMINLGMSRIYYYPQHNRDFLKLIVEDSEFRGEYDNFIKKIKTYRNYFTHNPCIDVLWRASEKKRFVIKREFIDKRRTLTDLRLGLNKNVENFVDPRELIKMDLIDTLKIINRLWKYLIDEMNELKQLENYKNLIFNYKRE